MRKTYSLGKRLLAFAVTLALVLTFMPRVALNANAAVEKADMVSGSKKVDPYTIHNWKQYFDIMSTEYTGGVWTDKSVFNSFSEYLAAEGVTGFVGPNGSAVSNDVMAMLGTDDANFLIAMSAMTANKSISGSSSTPMDNMLVLDVSGSMQGNNAVAMVEATNRAIKTLLDQNVNNRVGVILYSGNHQQGNSQTNTASLLLPLGRYTTTNTMNVDGGTIPAYLTISGSGNNQTVRVANSVDNGTAANEKTVRGGTYIQNGLYQAWEQFADVTDVKVPAGQPQAGTQRTPVIILMSDGAPTAATSNYNNVQTSNVGNGTNTSDRMGFLTQLTAAYVRGKVQEKYGTAPKFYTLGVGTGNDNIATSVLNPAGSSNTLTGYWTTFMNGTTGENVRVNNWSIYKDAAVAGKNYVDQYWLTNNADGLINAFNEIVNTIVLESEHYSTLVDISQGAHLSGYVTFEDELGQLMEVKSVKGMVMGDTVFTGAELAKGMTSGVLGTVDGPTAAGDELVRTIKERMGITETSVAQTLIDNAYNAGQLSYTSATEYSNYIGWYADADGNYLGFWQESDGYTAENAPEGAAYINKSYGYLGAPLTQDGAGSDMMHIVVMVHTEIATGHQSVVYKIPASLLPSVTYHVELNGEDITDPTSLTRDDADPIRLLFEVGLRSDINTVNLEQKIAEHEAKGGHVHENADGTYSFYTNSWGSGDGNHNVNYDEPLTHLVAESHFHPSLENERYYHVADDLVYSDQNGTVYSGASAPTGQMYFARPYYEMDGGNVRYTVEYAPINATVLVQAQKGDNGWYIPEGTAHSLTRFAQTKTENTTDTLNYSWNPVILHDSEGYHSYTFMGNNGTFTLAPAQGISLHKTVTREVSGAPDTFQFKVTLSQAVADLKVTDTDGDPLENVHTVSGNVITVNIQKDQTVVITGIPTGVTYTVEEVANGYYTPVITGATGTVEANTVSKVEAQNVPRIFNDLIVSKDIMAPDWMTDISALENTEFTISVNVSGADANTAYTTSVAGTTLQTDGSGNGAVTFSLKDGQSATVYRLPAGAEYAVQETNVPAGYTSNTQTAITGQIPADESAVARVLNTYAPQSASVSFNMAGAKNFHNGTGPVADSDWPAEGFTVNLYRYADGSRQLVETVNVTAAAKSWEIPVTQTFTETGVYRFQIVEEKGSQPDIVYDVTSGLFEIVVTDDGSGKLQISQIRPVEDTVDIAVNGSNVSVITKNFENYKEAGSVTIPVEKVIEGSSAISKNEFAFGLYDGNELVETIVGDGSFVIAGYAADFATAKQYTIREIVPAVEDRIVGMTYDGTVYTVSVVWDATQSKLVYSFDGSTETTASFKNIYETTYSTPAINLGGEKTITGDRTSFVANESYTIELYKTGADFVVSGSPEQTKTVSGNNYAYEFGGLSFSEEGTYYYVIREKAGTQGGVTYDATEYHVTVIVKKAADGNKTILAATHTVTKFGTAETVADNALDFVNTYAITGTAEVNIHGLKKLTGRELIAGEFEFGLYENGSLVQSVKNATNGKFHFAPITYTEPGTHTYTVKEIVPTEKLGGVTYSNAEYTVKVEVTDNGAGGLTAKETIRLPNASVASYDDVIFTNTYTAESAEKTLVANKSWFDTDAGANKTVPADKFSVTLYKADENYNRGDVVKTAKIGADAKAAITVQYTKIGTYYYVLHEDMIKDETATGYDPTVAYDASRYLIRDVVTDDGKGQLHVIRTIVKDGVGEVDEIALGNLYTPVAAQHVISGTKVLTGRNLALQDGEFTFELYEGTELLQSVQNVGDTFTFAAIDYEKSGTYTYKVVEKLPDGHVNGVKNGITYDQTQYTYTVKVEDVNGQLTVTETSHTTAELKFTNTYEGAGTQISISGIKNFNKAMNGGEFTFELYEGGTYQLIGTRTNGQSTPGANGTHDATFTFVIPLESAGGHMFVLMEKNHGENLAGVAYSPETYVIFVDVTDNNNGQLVAGTPRIVKAGIDVNEIKFQNSYSVTPVTDASLQITKKMIGDRTHLLDGETYTFRLYKGSEYIMQAENDQSGAVKFSGIRIETPGTHVFTIKEVVPAGGVKDGVTYTTAEITATVEVTDNGDGTLSVGTPVYTNGGVLENTYTLTGPADFDLVGEKRMEGRSLNANDHFTFLLKDAQGQTVATADNSGEIIRFEGVVLNDLGDYYFTVVEQAPAGGVKDGVTYSTEVYDVYVRVTDNGKGQMVASAPVVTKGGTAAELVFTNTYAVTEGTTATIEGKKTLNGKTLRAEQFTFELYAGTDTTAQPIATVKNSANGSFKFENVALNTLGTNTFTVIEKLPDGHVNGKLDGITYSNLAYTVTVETTDNGVGGMTAGQPVYSLGTVAQTQMEFINTYAVEGSANAVIEGFKTLEGGKKLEANMFTFELYEGDQPTGTPIDRVQNAADGSIKFNLSFDKDDIGTHTYTVKEVAPDGYVADGIRYTYLFYNVDIVVEDNGVGGLAVKAPVYRLGDDVAAEMEFVNVYTPEDQNVDLTIEKVVEILSGEKEVGPEGFKFKVEDKDGKTVATLTTDEDGKAVHTLTFNAEDIGKTFTYKITEIDTKKPGITYSDAVYEVSITIGQEETGELTTSMTVNGQAVFAVRAFFRNTYEAPELPQTGDSNDLMLYAAVMALSALGFVAMLVLRKKEQYN